MTFVILQAPNNGYYWLVKGGSNKHFELEDSGFKEIDCGEYELMRDKINFLEWMDATNGGEMECITLKRGDAYCYHTDKELLKILEINQDFLNEYEIVDNHNWFGKY